MTSALRKLKVGELLPWNKTYRQSVSNTPTSYKDIISSSKSKTGMLASRDTHSSSAEIWEYHTRQWLDSLLDGIGLTVTTQSNRTNQRLNLGAPSPEFISCSSTTSLNSANISLWNWLTPEKRDLDKIKPQLVSLPEDCIYPIDFFSFLPDRFGSWLDADDLFKKPLTTSPLSPFLQHR